MMACSTACHKIAKKQRRENLAAIQPQNDANMADAEIAAITESNEFPLPAPTQLMHKRTMPEGLQTGIDNSLPASKHSQKSIKMERPKVHRKLDFQTTLGTGSDNMSKITMDQVDTSPSSVQDSMLCTAGSHVENPSLPRRSEKQQGRADTSATSTERKFSSQKTKNAEKAALCASNKRKLDAYRARPLKPKEGELANENNEMFKKILQSKLSNKFDRPNTIV